ncbi:hypothetical protein CK203_104531 [Vitis vinifera]|uniref:Uncharacterized protein n=1 Tax=Vitis vinifera TaxID=29760 RepID=A0A438D3R7_VITVI|nr:hypothetical protein CK203_104531 [Vitis vinifera]
MVETSRDWSEKLLFALSLRVALEQQILEADWAQARLDQLNLLDERRLRAADHVIKGLIRDPRGKFKPNWSGPYFIRELTPRPLHG